MFFGHGISVHAGYTELAEGASGGRIGRIIVRNLAVVLFEKGFEPLPPPDDLFYL